MADGAAWSGIGAVALASAGTYVALLALLRVSGNRTLAQLRAFDLVVTVALGSLLATAATQPGSGTLRALAAAVVLVVLQTVVAYAATRWRVVERAVTASPRLLAHDGRFLQDALRSARVSEEEVRMALREADKAGVGEAGAVVLEPNGRVSVVSRGEGEALSDVRRS